MQLVKNLFLWPGRSYIRKVLEIPLAIVLDLVWSKKRIMEAYLNVAEWGDGVFGAEAAARRAFGKGAAALNAREAALLATPPPCPIRIYGRRPDLAATIQAWRESSRDVPHRAWRGRIVCDK
jgi:monofunctional biosynthetic peptidoglycan transglycosylase